MPRGLSFDFNHILKIIYLLELPSLLSAFFLKFQLNVFLSPDNILLTVSIKLSSNWIKRRK